MGRNAVGARPNGDFGRVNRVRMSPAARIAHGRHVIDVDAETEPGEGGHRIGPAPQPARARSPGRTCRGDDDTERSTEIMAVRLAMPLSAHSFCPGDHWLRPQL